MKAFSIGSFTIATIAFSFFLGKQLVPLKPLPGSNARNEVTQGKSPEAATVTKLFLECPSYWITEPTDVKEKAIIMDFLDRISRFDDASIEAGIEAALKEKMIEGHDSKDDIVFLLIRYMFDPPEWADFKDNLFGGWISRPVNADGTQINMIWPFKYDADHRLVLASRIGGFNGPAYNGLGELAYFKANFPRRKH